MLIALLHLHSQSTQIDQFTDIMAKIQLNVLIKNKGIDCLDYFGLLPGFVNENKVLGMS